MKAILMLLVILTMSCAECEDFHQLQALNISLKQTRHYTKTYRLILEETEPGTEQYRIAQEQLLFSIGQEKILEKSIEDLKRNSSCL